MTALKALALVLLLLLLLGSLRVGGAGEYSADGVRAWLRVGPFHICLYPIREKKGKGPADKKKKPKRKAEKPEEDDEDKQGGTAELVKQCLPLVCEAAGELKRRIRIDRLLLDYTFAGKEDAAAAAVGFGYSNAAAGMILALFEQNFDVKERRVRTAVDFTSDRARIYLYAAISARLGQLLSFALRFGWKFLKVYRQTKNPKKEAI